MKKILFTINIYFVPLVFKYMSILKPLYFTVVFSVLPLFIFTGCNNNLAYYNTQGYDTSQAWDHVPVSRALAAKILSHHLGSAQDIYNMDSAINFNDVQQTDWHFPYINIVYIHGVMGGYEQNFKPNYNVTVGQAMHIFNNINANIPISATEENYNLPISLALFNDLYLTALQNISGDLTVKQYFGITEKNLVILATEENNEILAGGNVITSKGAFAFTGFTHDNFLLSEIRVLAREHDIITVLDIINNTPLLNYTLVTGVFDGYISIFFGGVERFFYNSNIRPNIQAGDIISVIVSYDNLFHEYILHNEIIKNPIIERVTLTHIDLYGYGRVMLSPNIAVYNTFNNIRWVAPRNLIVGTNIANFVKSDNEIVAVVINKRPHPTYIRVAINTTGFTSLIHNEVQIMGSGNFTVTDLNGKRSYSANEVVTFSSNSDIVGYRAYINAYEDDVKFTILNINRQWPGGQSPMYHGNMQVAWEGNGFSLVNVVDLERYLMSVVPSEMPSSFGLYASMVQAVTARSYAYNQFLRNSMAHLGANVQDSVMDQVYNNLPSNDISVQAVNNTRGQVLSHNGQVVSANFFSTSAGVTANSGEVWAVHGRLPSYTPTFLMSQRKYLQASFGDLRNEDNARIFFNTQDINAYDNISPWFRWNVTMTPSQIAQSINNNISQRYSATPNLIKTLQNDGSFRSQPIQTIGNLIDIEVKTRGEGGNIMEILVTGTEATALIITEFNIRSLLAPTNSEQTVILNRWDGSTVSNFTMLPSSFFTIERLTGHNGEIQQVRFIGGGFGHGAGMSQYGARGMISRGYSYIDVLQRFYYGTNVVNIDDL